jgi:peptidoglycan/LPS O-acetylase OafA/YrhL
MFARATYTDWMRDDLCQKSLYPLFIGLLLGTTLGTMNYFLECFDYGFFSPQIKYTIYSLFPAIITPFYNIALFYLCLYFTINLTNISPNIYTRIFYKIGKYSFGIYLVHILVLMIHEPVLRILNISVYNWLYFPIGFAFILGLSLVLVFSITKLPYNEYIIGSTR